MSKKSNRMKWKVKHAKGEEFPWRIILCGTKDEVCYGAARNKNTADVYTSRLNESQKDSK